MDINSLPIKEAVVTHNTKKEPEERVPIYWFEKEDGTFIATKEKEAWEILRGRIQVMNGKIRFKYLGMSNGQLYWEEMNKLPEILKEGQEKASEFIRDVERRERETANPSIRPRNYDVRGLNKQPVSLDVGGLV